ncbi:alpha/beta hydrolase [Kitasatospora sp. NPDC049285]|uniref:alpha/beta hydrolase n=1 Tax=Kitasatospora sp. NPDC049285 TaxID=3157096 RepID=UPI00342B6B1D
MSIDVPTLRDAEPDRLFGAADAYAVLATAVGEHADTWRDGVDARVRGSGWSGDAAADAERSLARSSAKLVAAQLELVRIAPVLREGAEAFLLAQAKLRAALADAASGGYRVADDGGVSWPPSAAERHDPDAPDRARQGAALRDRIAEALTEAAHADQVTAERLRRHTDAARTGAGLDPAFAATELASTALSSAFGGGPEDLVRAGLPGPDAPPTEVNAWWKSLPADERQRLVTEYPAEIGNRDGIPALARDRANRIHLDRLIAELSNRQDPSEQDRKKLAGFQAVRDRLRDDQGKQPPSYLLVIGDQGQGRAALSYGDPDTADDVVAYVPGLNTEVRNLGGGDANRARDLWQTAHDLDPTRTTASIAWLGYDAPQAKEFGPDALAVAGDARAKQGGEAYQGFLQGLRAAHEGPPAHLTALGHSYGSLTVGQAAQRPGGIPVDDVILVGSPGTGAQHAAQLGVDPAHVWVGAAEHDPVSHLPSQREATGAGTGAVVGGLVGGLPGAVLGGFLGDHLGRHGDPHELWFGQDPASAEFGARRFDVADGPLGFASHSDYWNQGDGRDGHSLRNMGMIVSGHGDRVSGQERR